MPNYMQQGVLKIRGMKVMSSFSKWDYRCSLRRQEEQEESLLPYNVNGSEKDLV